LESDSASLALIIFGILGCLIGFFMGGWFWSNLIYVGISWFVAGVAYYFAEREITDGGFLAAFLFGVIGAILWIVIDMSRTQKVSSASLSWKYGDRRSQERSKVSPEDYKCRSCFWFGKPACKRQEKLLNAEPCEDFMRW
jgi:hypothetical protein